MVVTVLVTEAGAAAVVEGEAAAARVAEAKAASGRGGGSALAARRWRSNGKWRAFCDERDFGGWPAHRATLPIGLRLVNWKKNI